MEGSQEMENVIDDGDMIVVKRVGDKMFDTIACGREKRCIRREVAN